MPKSLRIWSWNLTKPKTLCFYPVGRGDHPAVLAKLFGSQELELRAKNHMNTGQSLAAGTIIQIPISPDKIIKKNLKGSYDDVVPIFIKSKRRNGLPDRQGKFERWPQQFLWKKWFAWVSIKSRSWCAGGVDWFEGPQTRCFYNYF